MVVVRLLITAPLATAWRLRSACGSASVAGWAGHAGRGPVADRAGRPAGPLTKVVLEGALEGEMDAHLGYAKHDPAGRDGGNSGNGHRARAVLINTGSSRGCG
jgi:hypothetical protein